MKEEEIRPKKLFDEYLRLSAIDSEELFNNVERRPIDCPACGHAEADHAFTKHGFAYENCRYCQTLFVNPRPEAKAFAKLYRDSESSRYWSNTFFPNVIEARREKIFKKRVLAIEQKLAEQHHSPRAVVEIGAGHGVFLEEWRKRNQEIKLTAVEPSPEMAQICRDKGLQVVEKFAEEVTAKDVDADLVVCFEVLEHVYDPLQFLRGVVGMMRSGCTVLMTTLCFDGFDINLLREKSKSVSPPHHINFMTKLGFRELFQRAGLIEVVVETPGVLDVDIVKSTVADDPDLARQLGTTTGFLQKLFDDDVAARFQQFLIDAKLSSHAWIWAKAP